MAVGDIFQVTLIGELAGQTTQTVLHYIQTLEVIPGSEASGLAGAIDAGPAADLLNWQGSDFRYVKTMVQKIRPFPIELAVFNNFSTGLGGGLSVSAPPTVAATVTKQTPLAGRAFRGRIFVPGVPIGVTQDGVLTGTGLANLQIAVAAFDNTITDPNNNDYEPCLFSRATGTPTTLVAVRANPILRSQRRREVGVGQ